MSNADRQLGGDSPKGANEEYFDALVRHQVFLLRYAGGLTKDVIQLLNESEEELRSIIMALPGLSERRAMVQRLNAIRRLREQAWAAVGREWTSNFTEFALSEASFAATAAQTVVPVVLDLTLPAPGLLRSLVGEFPVEGRVLQQWLDNVSRTDVEGILRVVQRGMVQGQSNQEIARAVLGLRSVQGRDGFTQQSRRHAAAITRTLTNGYSNRARDLMLEQNAQVFTEELYVATLDARTTPICRALDGQRFPRGEGPRPPLHINCRSLRVAVIDGQVVGSRPAKPATRRMLLREYSERNNLGRVTSRDALPRGHKTSFDQFERRRLRELIGQVPAKTSYGEWLRRQSNEFQEDVLGQTKAKLFREGGLTLERFVDRNGRELRLSELAQSDAAAFRAAGLDPARF